jgi:hypothetical protein
VFHTRAGRYRCPTHKQFVLRIRSRDTKPYCSSEHEGRASRRRIDMNQTSAARTCDRGGSISGCPRVLQDTAGGRIHHDSGHGAAESSTSEPLRTHTHTHTHTHTCPFQEHASRNGCCGCRDNGTRRRFGRRTPRRGSERSTLVNGRRYASPAYTRRRADIWPLNGSTTGVTIPAFSNGE